MGTILASKIIADAAEVLLDPDYDRITQADHLGYLNDGQAIAALLKPGVSTEKGNITLVAGPYQTMPADALSIIRGIQNMGAGGATPGDMVRTVQFDQFTKNNPQWINDTESATVQLLILDPGDPDHFWVYPPQPSTSMGTVSVIQSVIPADVAAVGSPITIHDIYEPFLKSYILYRAYEITTGANDRAKSTQYWNSAMEMIGRKDLIDRPQQARRSTAQ